MADSVARFGAAIRAGRAHRHADTRIRVSIRDGWANINEAGNWNSAHTHGSSHVSGVVYVDAGNSTDGRSCTLLQNPAPGFVRRFSSISTSAGDSADSVSGTSNGAGEDDICLSPAPGSVLLFPGWLPHAVLPHDGNMPRLSISFNADFVYPTRESTLSSSRDSGSGAARTNAYGEADSGSTFDQSTVGKDAHNLAFNEASTDQEWLAAARKARSKSDGTTTAWLRHAWPSDAIVWSLPRLPLSAGEGDDGVFSKLALGQKPAPLSDSIAATIHELVCLLTARYSQVLARRSGADTELGTCEALTVNYDLLRMSAGARTYLSSSTSATADDSNCGDRTAYGDGSDGHLATKICGVVRLDVAPPRAVELQGEEGEQPRRHETVPLAPTSSVRSRGDVTVGSFDPRPEYGFELNATDGDTRLLHSLGLETRSARESWNEQVLDMRPSRRFRLGHGEAAVLPCDAWVSSESTGPVVVVTFVASR